MHSIPVTRVSYVSIRATQGLLTLHSLEPPAVELTLVAASLEHGTLADADANGHLVPWSVFRSCCFGSSLSKTYVYCFWWDEGLQFLGDHLNIQLAGRKKHAHIHAIILKGPFGGFSKVLIEVIGHAIMRKPMKKGPVL